MILKAADKQIQLKNNILECFKGFRRLNKCIIQGVTKKAQPDFDARYKQDDIK